MPAYIELTEFVERAVFVFGSNVRGIHGSGSAKFAFQYRGAKIGVGEGLVGQSYALPTKQNPSKLDKNYIADLNLLQDSVSKFLAFARKHKELSFMITRVGCGLAGFKDDQVKLLFKDAPENCLLPGMWTPTRDAMIVAGSRSIDENDAYNYLQENIAGIFKGRIVTGMAKGVDSAAYKWASDYGLVTVKAPARWDKYGKASGYIRNQWMSWYATDLLALWDGESRGTKHMIDIAHNDGLFVKIIQYQNTQPNADYREGHYCQSPHLLDGA